MTRTWNLPSLLATAMATCLFAAPAAAQQGQDGQQNQQQTQQEAQQQRQERQRQQDSQRQREQQQQRQPAAQQGQQSQQSRQFALQPRGWVRIAVDYDQDNRFDATETIYYYDLVRAQQRSSQRRDEQAQRQPQQDRGQPGQSQMARSQRQRQQIRRVSGEVTELRTVRLSDGNQHRVAKIETQQGQTMPILLGSNDQVSRLDLQTGDRIAVWGTRARINDRPILAARRIQAGEQNVSVSPLQDRNLRRVRGQIASMRTTRFRGRDQQFRVAQVKLNSGRTAQVILGPQDRLADLNLQQGDEIRLLVRPGRLNGESALVAEQVRANEQTVRIQRPEGQRFSAR